MDLPGQRKASQVLLSVASPSQKSPPNAGTGSLQKRTRVWLPSPHVTEQAPNPDHSLHSPSTGHASTAQASVLTSSPTQSRPPCTGAGSVQFLVRKMVPPPQVTSHSVQLLQADHAPSTKKKETLAFFAFFLFSEKKFRTHLDRESFRTGQSAKHFRCSSNRTPLDFRYTASFSFES